jgi:hypothetical protein
LKKREKSQLLSKVMLKMCVFRLKTAFLFFVFSDLVARKKVLSFQHELADFPVEKKVLNFRSELSDLAVEKKVSVFRSARSDYPVQKMLLIFRRARAIDSVQKMKAFLKSSRARKRFCKCAEKYAVFELKTEFFLSKIRETEIFSQKMIL